MKKKITVKTIIIILLTALLCGCVESNVSVEESDTRPDVLFGGCHELIKYWFF